MRYDHMDIPPVAPQVTRIELHDVSCWVEPARGGWTYRVEGLISQSVRVVAILLHESPSWTPWIRLA